MTPDELTMIAEAAERILADHTRREVLHDAEAGTWPEALWAAVENAGLTLALVSEERGGTGLPVETGFALIGLSAEYAAPIPFAETMIAAWLLDRAGIDIPAGPLTFAAFDGSITAAADMRRVTGRAARVPWACKAGLVAIVPGEQGAMLALLDAGDAALEPGDNMAGEPRDNAVIDTSIATDRVAPSPVTPQQVQQLGAAIRAVQIAGALKQASQLAVSYSQERVQFGRSLSKFQAIQQNLAVLATQAAVAAMAANMASDAVAKGQFLPGIAIAKARNGEAAGVGAAIAHQVHGAMGFTREHDLQFTTRRLLAWRDEYGNESVWNRVYGEMLFPTGADNLWASITAGKEC